MSAPTSRAWLQAAARRLATGSERLATHLTRRLVSWVRDIWRRTNAWLSEASGIAWALRLAALLTAAWFLRKIGVAVATAAARRLDAAPWLLWPALGLWLIAAWRAGSPGWTPGPAPAAAEQPEPEEEPEAVTLAKEHPVGPTLDGVLDAARRLGTPHVHLAAIDAHLGAQPGAARRLLTEAAIPISDVRMQGRGSSTGIKGADIPPLPAPRPGPVGDVVDAGHSANNINNDTLRVKSEAGMTIILDPSERRAYTV